MWSKTDDGLGRDERHARDKTRKQRGRRSAMTQGQAHLR